MKVGLSCYLSVRWEEARLIFAGNASQQQENSAAALSSEMRKYLWMPDLYIYHLKSISAPLVFQPFSGEEATMIINQHQLLKFDLKWVFNFRALRSKWNCARLFPGKPSVFLVQDAVYQLSI